MFAAPAQETSPVGTSDWINKRVLMPFEIDVIPLRRYETTDHLPVLDLRVVIDVLPLADVDISPSFP